MHSLHSLQAAVSRFELFSREDIWQPHAIEGLGIGDFSEKLDSFII